MFFNILLIAGIFFSFLSWQQERSRASLNNFLFYSFVGVFLVAFSIVGRTDKGESFLVFARSMFWILAPMFWLVITSDYLKHKKHLYTNKYTVFIKEDWKLWGIVAGFLLFQFFKWDLIEIFTVFLFFIVEGVAWIVFIVGFICAIIVAFRKKHLQGLYLPLIYCGVFLIVWFVPLTQAWLYFNFYNHLLERQEIVELIKKGELKDIDPDNYRFDLPSRFHSSSMGGAIEVIDSAPNNLEVLFYTFAGILDNYSGFIYSERDRPPVPDSGSKYIDVIKFKDHWYFISST